MYLANDAKTSQTPNAKQANDADGSYTATVAFLETLYLAGISHCFVNLGSDHPSFLEAIVRARAGHGRSGAMPMPEFVSVTHEFVYALTFLGGVNAAQQGSGADSTSVRVDRAMSAAQGYYQATGKMAALILHVDAGLLNAGGGIHNIARARCPMLIFSGMSALTIQGEKRGSRTEFINWVQDVHDMPGIVRNYSKYSYEFRTGANMSQVTMRAVQIAMTEPRGPVYLFGAREIMEEELSLPPVEINPLHWQPIARKGLLPDQVAEVLKLLLGATSPLVITSWAGNNHRASLALIALCEKLGMPLLDASPFALNMPATHPMYLGSHWSGMGQNPALAEADVVLVVDSDIPFIPVQNRPCSTATMIHIDSDPLKIAMPLFYIPAQHRFEVQSAVALEQILEALSLQDLPTAVSDRQIQLEQKGKARKAALLQASTPVGREPAIAAVGLAALATLLPADCFVISEAISNYGTVLDHILLQESRRFATSGASSLGYGGGAAVGAKLGLRAHEANLPGMSASTLVCCITGDGSYMFSVPSSVQHLSTRIKAPFLTVILANGGWKSPQQSAILVHQDGYAARSSAADVGVSFGPAEDRPDYSAMAVAAAGGPHRAWGARVVCGSPEMVTVFENAIRATLRGKSATVELIIPDI